MATNVVDAPSAEIAPVAANGYQIAAGMCGIDLIVKRPTGRVKVRKNVEVKALDAHGSEEQLTAKQATRPHLIIDGADAHPAWAQLDENARKFDTLVRVSSVNDARRGFHLIPMSRAGKFVTDASALRVERKGLAEWLASAPQYAVWMDNLKKRFNGHFYLLTGKFPTPEELVEKFDVAWTIHPLTPINPGSIDFKHLNDEDRMAIVTESTKMVKDLAMCRAQAIFDEVFGQVLGKCQEITSGKYFKGTRKFGAIEEIVALLERMLNFQEFAQDPTVIDHANKMLGMFKEVTDISDLNKNKGKNQITAAITEATKPFEAVLAAMLKAHRPGSGKSARLIDV